MQSFPKPLSAKEEKECIARCRQGDQKARQCLIEKNLRLVAYIAKKYNVGDKDMDDLISIGTIGLIKGIDTFDETKNIFNPLTIENYNDFYAEQKEEMEEKALGGGLMEQAEDQAVLLTKQILGPLAEENGKELTVLLTKTVE